MVTARALRLTRTAKGRLAVQVICPVCFAFLRVEPLGWCGVRDATPER